MSEIATEFQAVARIPFVKSAFIASKSGSSDGNAQFVIHTTWTQRDLVRMERTCFHKSYLATASSGFGKLECHQFGMPVDNTNELRVAYSQDGSLKAVFAKFSPKDKKGAEDKESVEIYSPLGKVATNDVAASKRHGNIYTDSELGCFELSPVESSTHILYVAEKYRPPSDSFFSVMANKFPEDPELANKSLGEKFVYREDWGEQMQKKSQPVLCILDWNDNNASILANIPDGISPGQAVWTPDGSGIVFVGFDHLPERLGLVYCPIRRSRLYYLELGHSKMALPLTFTDLAVRSPRFNLSGTALVYLETEMGGPHFHALRLMMIDWNNQQSTPTVIVPVPVGTIKQTDFPGLYTDALPKRCWSRDNKRIVLHTIWRSSQQIIVVNTENKTVQCLTGPQLLEGMRLARWEVLDVWDDIIVASASSPNICPRLFVAKLPPAGKEIEIKWALIDEGAGTDKELEKEVQLMEWDVEIIKDPGSGIEYEAVWMFPSLRRSPPVILWPHGGPHGCSIPGFDVFISTLIRLEYAVIFVNYRGSAGFGEKNLRSLLGKIGQNDIEDCFRALDVVLGKKGLNNTDTDLFYQGGSHGGFIGAHLIGQFPDIFKACALRNPVINLASKLGGTEIPDWGYVECGLEYRYDDPPIIPMYSQLIARSPIVHAHKVTTPTLILIGEKDRRVPPTQGMELYRALKLRGVPTKVLRYPDSDHPIAEIEAESDSFVQMVNWFRQFGRTDTKSAGKS
ncbi:acylamino-acid-releasing enzyme-like [Paramacrobiotus metropolitanus]|uniref:acylamino-acid-releasing enzyme-like n=1 Tax=Paramacrobiotus metropolitanus TaxID=2943436 RepID=UPI00244594FB|nr:acylamino-acid-releasing enzyme-like [Paramacrobiotus metropolitanus]